MSTETPFKDIATALGGAGSHSEGEEVKEGETAAAATADFVSVDSLRIDRTAIVKFKKVGDVSLLLSDIICVCFCACVNMCVYMCVSVCFFMRYFISVTKLVSVKSYTTPYTSHHTTPTCTAAYHSTITSNIIRNFTGCLQYEEIKVDHCRWQHDESEQISTSSEEQ